MAVLALIFASIVVLVTEIAVETRMPEWLPWLEGVSNSMTALFGVAMVIIGAATPSSGKGASLVIDLAAQLQTSLGGVARWAFLLGAWGDC